MAHSPSLLCLYFPRQVFARPPAGTVSSRPHAKTNLNSIRVLVCLLQLLDKTFVVRRRQRAKAPNYRINPRPPWRRPMKQILLVPAFSEQVLRMERPARRQAADSVPPPLFLEFLESRNAANYAPGYVVGSNWLVGPNPPVCISQENRVGRIPRPPAARRVYRTTALIFGSQSGAMRPAQRSPLHCRSASKAEHTRFAPLG